MFMRFVAFPTAFLFCMGSLQAEEPVKWDDLMERAGLYYKKSTDIPYTGQITGQMQGRLVFRNDEERGRAVKLGVEDLARKYQLSELARGEVMFAATGVTDGSMLRGVRRTSTAVSTESLVMRSKTGTVRVVSGQHDLTKKTLFNFSQS